MQTMSITRALVELKKIDEYISQEVPTNNFVSLSVGRGANKKSADAGFSIQEMESKIKASWQRCESLLANRQKLKSAIVLANATTDVSILGKNYKVAEVIEMKSSINNKTQVLNTLRKQQHHAVTLAQQSNQKLDEQIDSNLKAVYGSDKSKIDSAMVAAITEPQKDQKEVQLIDPIKIQQKIDELQKEINDFKAEVDMVLSESNAKTTITVDLTAL